MNARLSDALQRLIAASGGRVWLVSGDRSPDEQKVLWERALKKYGSAEAARKYVAPPGKSNHEKGNAVDLGGDLALAARLAPSFGLYRPMEWEPWHFEIGGTKSASSAYTTPPNGQEPTTAQPPEPADYGQVLRDMIGMPADDWFSPSSWAMNDDTLPNPDNPDVFTTPKGGPGGIDEFMAAIRAKESSGNYKAVGASTKWGRATGGYQFLDSVWGNYKGYARAKDAPPEVQDAKARELMQTYYARFGNWADVAAAWFSGPNGKWSSAEVRAYVNDVLSRVRQKVSA